MNDVKDGTYIDEANKYDVDAISGATTSSEAFKSAVGKALLHSYDN